MQNIQLSLHFELREFTESATARGYGIVNEPPPEAVDNLKALCVNTLEPLREALGLPIIITSGYRCKALNELITHHSTRSQHRTGEAADFWVQGSKFKVQDQNLVQGSKFKVQDQNLVQGSKFKVQDQNLVQGSKFKVQGVSPRELLIRAFRTIITDPTVDYDQLIIYPTFIHVSYISRERNRHKLTKGFGNGKYCALSREEALMIC